MTGTLLLHFFFIHAYIKHKYIGKLLIRNSICCYFSEKFAIAQNLHTLVSVSICDAITLHTSHLMKSGVYATVTNGGE